MLKNNSVLLNVETICRTCLKEKSGHELRSLLDNDLTSDLSEVANTQLSLSPSLPTSICNNCFKNLSIAVDFKKQVRKAESYLRELICKGESDNVTVIYKTFTVLDSGVISQDCEGNIKEVAAAEVVRSDYVNQDANQESVVETVFKEDDNTYMISDATAESANYFVSHKDEAPSSIKAKPAPNINTTFTNVIRWAESESTLPPVELLNTEESSRTDANRGLQNQPPNLPKIVNLKCELCLMSFKYEFTYKKHLLKHGTPLRCELCLLLFYDSDKYLLHIKNDHPQYKPCACPNCEERFSTVAALKKHHRKTHTQNISKKFVVLKKCHTGSISYKCDICLKELSTSQSLRNHLKIHKGDKKHRCEICGSTFIHRFSLRAHMITHTGEKPFACEQCKKKFSTSSYLKIHSRTHTHEKPYACGFCNKKFVSRCALAAHEKAHTGEKKFQCDFCGWRTSRSADLRTHIRRHTGEKPYCCNQCGKSFKTASNLSAHRKTHLGLKEHVCTICYKAFGDPRTLKSHIRIHTGETPYQCDICGCRFKQSGQLSAHRKIHQIREVSDDP